MNKDSRTRRAWWRLLAGLLFALPVHTAAAEDAPPISTMLKEGWQIAGYSQAFDNRSTSSSSATPTTPIWFSAGSATT
jgi:hypothetical protein